MALPPTSGVVTRAERNSQVRQCLGFCSADSLANKHKKSAVQKPKHCPTCDFLSALVGKFYNPKATSTLQCGDTAEKAKEDETAVAEDLVEEEDEEEEEEDRDNDVEDVEEMSN